MNFIFDITEYCEQGGKPNSSLYFTGFQDKRLLYLDPHSVQNFTPLPLSVEDEKSYFCPNIRSLPISQLDPCMAIGFFCLNEQDLSGLWAELEELQRYSVFTLAESKPEYIKAWEDDQAFQVCDWNEICGGENHDRNSGHKDSYHDEDDEREIDGFVLCK